MEAYNPICGGNPANKAYARDWGINIIVTTIQKFSVVVNRMKELKGMRFGVIVDEVHSSQGGKGTKNLNKTLSLNIEDEVGVDDDIDY